MSRSSHDGHRGRARLSVAGEPGANATLTSSQIVNVSSRPPLRDARGFDLIREAADSSQAQPPRTLAWPTASSSRAGGCTSIKLRVMAPRGEGCDRGRAARRYSSTRTTPTTRAFPTARTEKSGFLVPFFVSRQVICGTVRVGIGAADGDSGFQISQRADFFEFEVGLETTLN